MSHTLSSPQLVGAEDCLRILFPCDSSRPALRTFRKWQANRYFPVHKLGRSTYFDPGEVREALDRRFRIDAAPAR